MRAVGYVDDFVEDRLAMITVPGAVGEDFNIGNPINTLTIYDLAKRTMSCTVRK